MQGGRRRERTESCVTEAGDRGHRQAKVCSLLLPTAARLGPLKEVIHRAEVVRDPVLAAVADQEDVDVSQLAPAMRAGPGLALDGRRLVELARLPVRTLDRPRDDVLEAAEGGLAVAGWLI